MTTSERKQRMLLEEYDAVCLTAQTEATDGKIGAKFSGDIACRVVREFLLDELGSKFKISDPNAYLIGCKTEFDLLVVKSTAEPRRYTNAYMPQEVKCAIEVKAKGASWGAKGKPDQGLQNLKTQFQETRQNFRITSILIEIDESSPKKATSIDYLARTREAMSPFLTFCFRNRRTLEPWDGQLQKLVEHLKRTLK